MEIIWIISLAAVHIGCFFAGAKVARCGASGRAGVAGKPKEQSLRPCGAPPFAQGRLDGANPVEGGKKRVPEDGQGGYPARTVGDAGPHKEDAQERQLRTLWHNIERYDGTAAGQREVEH